MTGFNKDELYQRALLAHLHLWCEDEWTPMKDAGAKASNLVNARTGLALEYDVDEMIKNRQELKARGLIVSAQRERRTWHIRLTEAGVEEAIPLCDEDAEDDSLDENKGKPKAEIPPVPFRIDRPLPAAAWREVGKLVKAGKLSLIVIPREQSTKVKAWDEA